MALQVTPNVGGTTTTVPIDPTAPTPVASTSTPTVPQYRIDFAGLTRAASVGLSTPTAIGDFEIAFSRIAANLKDALGILGDLTKASSTQARRTELADALLTFSKMAEWGKLIDDNTANIERQGNIIVSETARKTSAETAKGTLTTQRDGLQEQFNQNTRDMTALNTSIDNLRKEDSALIAERGRLDPKTNAGRIAEIDLRRGQIPNEITGLYNQISQKVQANQGLQTDINALNTRIGTLESTIKDATDKIGAADFSRSESRRIIKTTGEQMTLFYDAAIIAMKVAMGLLASDLAGDAALFETSGGKFDRLIQALASAVLDLGALLASSAVGKDVAAGEGSGAGLNLDVSSPNRFGQPNAPLARALAFAGIIAGVMGAVADLLNTIRQGLGMQTAEAFANAGAPRVKVGL